MANGRKKVIVSLARSAIYIGLFIAWGISVNRRVMQVQVRRQLAAAAGLMIFCFAVRTVRYEFAAEATVQRYLWYLYYFPMLFIPLSGLFTAILLGKSEITGLPKGAAFFTVVSGILFILVVTNDLHQLVFTFPAEKPWDNKNFRKIGEMTKMRGKKYFISAAVLFAAAGSVNAASVQASETAGTADTLQVTLVDTIEYSEWIYGSPAVRAVYGDNGAALAELDGTLITESVYDLWEFQYHYGYFTAMEAGKWVNGRGLLAEDGSTVIPFQYGTVDVLSPEWAVAYTWTESSSENYDNIVYGETDQYYRCETADIYYLPDGVCAGSFSCEEYQEAAAVGYSINIRNRNTDVISTYDSHFNLLGTGASDIFDDTFAEKEYTRFYENGLCGLKDRNGNTVLEPVYSWMENISDRYVEVSSNGRCGLADLNGNLVVPIEYDYIRMNYSQPYDIRYGEMGYNAHGYFCVVQDGKIGYVNEFGEMTCVPTYTEDTLEQTGVTAIYTNSDGNTCILAADGAETVLDGYEGIYAEEFSGGMLYTVYDEAYNSGLIDWHGNEVFPCEYLDFSVSGNGRYLLAYRDYDYAELYRITYPGEELLPEETTAVEAEAVTETEFAEETETETVTAQLVQIAEVEEAGWVNGSPDLLHTSDYAGGALLSIDGDLMTEPLYDSREFLFKYGYISARLVDNEITGSGVLSLDGSVVIPFQYGAIEILSSEWAIAYTLTESTGENYDKAVYGETYTYYLYDDADIYYLPEKSCVASIDRDNFSDAAAVGHSINIQSGENTSTYDTQFHLLSAETAYLFDDTYAQLDYITVQENGKYGLADSAGNILIDPEYDWIYEPIRGYAVAELDGKYGVLDLKGNVVVPLEYDSVEEGYYLPYDDLYGEYGYNANGYFAVEKDGKLGYVNESGEITCEPVYDESMLYNYGASALLEDENGNYVILAADGTETVIEKYDDVNANDYSSGLFYTVYDEDYNTGLIDWHGNELLPCEYSDISLSGNGRYVLASKGYGDYGIIYEIRYPDDDAEDAEETSEVTEETATEEAAEPTDIPEEETTEKAEPVTEETVTEESGTESDEKQPQSIIPMPSSISGIYAGNWMLVTMVIDGEAIDAEMLGMSAVLTLNEDGSAMFMDEPVLWGIKKNELVLGTGDDDDLKMLFAEDGTLILDEMGQRMIFSKETPDSSFIGIMYICTSASAGNTAVDPESIGRYDVIFYEDRTCQMTIGGTAMQKVSWRQEENSVIVDYYGQEFVFEITEEGLEMNYYGAMLLTYTPEQ